MHYAIAGLTAAAEMQEITFFFLPSCKTGVYSDTLAPAADNL